jgi:hypothetical protein
MRLKSRSRERESDRDSVRVFSRERKCNRFQIWGRGGWRVRSSVERLGLHFGRVLHKPIWSPWLAEGETFFWVMLFPGKWSLALGFPTRSQKLKTESVNFHFNLLRLGAYVDIFMRQLGTFWNVWRFGDTTFKKSDRMKVEANSSWFNSSCNTYICTMYIHICLYTWNRNAQK